MRSVFVAMIMVVSGCSAALAEDVARTVPGGEAQIRLSFAPVVRRVTPAVVNVYAQHVEQARSGPMFSDPFLQQFFGAAPGASRERVQRSLGSGVIVDAAGLVVTNFHVVENATEVKVALSDKREFAAEIVLKDQRADLAVLRLKGVREAFPVLDFADSDAVQVGDLVLAVGDPFGVGQTVTSGIVSALARSQVGQSDYQSFIQTDAAINPGNSGGALVDMDGRLVGVNTAIVSRSGGNIGIGFAIPSAMVRVVVDSAKAGSSRVLRPWFGATVQTVSADIAESLALPRPTGALVGQIFPKSPADAAGLRAGDVVLALDGIAVNDPDELGYRFATKRLGGAASLEIWRNGKRQTLTVALRAPDQNTPADETVITGNVPLAGATLSNITPALGDDLGLAPDASGVIITGVRNDSAAEAYGFRAKDILLALNGEELHNTADVDRILKQRDAYWRITINRGGRLITSTLGR